MVAGNIQSIGRKRDEKEEGYRREEEKERRRERIQSSKMLRHDKLADQLGNFLALMLFFN